MSRAVRLATCQPPAPTAGRAREVIVARALQLAYSAAEMGADIICLPESLNVVGLTDEQARAEAARSATFVVDFQALCSRHGTYAVVPVIHCAGAKVTNTAFLLGRDGSIVGSYDKVHTTATERETLEVSAGDHYPVFDLDFGRVGIMTCYDGCFPEPARILALQGAEMILFPSLQRSYTETHLDLQVRARAFDNFLYVVRSTYGTEPTDVWEPGVIVGKSCIVGPDGTVLADLGRATGTVVREVDLDAPERGRVSHGGKVGVVRDMRLADRRPETYGVICRPSTERR